MPCGYHINHDEGLLTITATTRVAIEEANQLAEEILIDPEFDPSLPQLVDLRGIKLTRSAASTIDFRDFMLQTYRPNIQASMAIVVDDSLDRRTLANLYHLACNMSHTELFDHYEQALKWLMRREFADRSASTSAVRAACAPG
jgi:hypothetical protein